MALKTASCTDETVQLPDSREGKTCWKLGLYKIPQHATEYAFTLVAAVDVSCLHCLFIGQHNVWSKCNWSATDQWVACPCWRQRPAGREAVPGVWCSHSCPVCTRRWWHRTDCGSNTGAPPENINNAATCLMSRCTTQLALHISGKQWYLDNVQCIHILGEYPD